MINFNINVDKPVSAAFRERGYHTFHEALRYIKNLPYYRNVDKTDAMAVLKDACGTCSTKHALLYSLAKENGHNEYLLMLGIFKMNAQNTPKVAGVLQQHGLSYIPEAHNYLRLGNDIIDCTNARSAPADFIPDLLIEISIQPDQITVFKVGYHKKYLDKWRINNTPYTLDEIWNVREQCIKALSVNDL